MQITHKQTQFLHLMGWPQHRINAAVLILENGSDSQKNKLFSEVAPGFRSLWSRV